MWALAVACTSTSEPTATNEEACQLIIDACHPKDDGSEGQINDCHALAHEGDAQACTPMQDECVALCDAAPPLGGHDTDDHETSEHETDGEGTGGHESGEHDTGGHDTGHDSTDGGETTADEGGSTGEGSTGDGVVSAECMDHCDCLASECAEFEGYPFGSQEVCHEDCMGLSAEERSCYMMWCPQVSESPGIALYLCEHAWGELGLNEC